MAVIQCTQTEMEQRVRAELMRRSQRDDINRVMAITFDRCSAAERCWECHHQISDWDLNVFDTMHGGLITFLLDTAMGILCRAYTGDHVAPTLDIHVNFLRPVTRGATVYVKATIARVGRKVIHLNAELWTENRDCTCAMASATFFRSDNS